MDDPDASIAAGTPPYINIPVTGLFDTDVSLTFVNVVIPIKNKEKHSVGLNWSLLCQEFFDLRGTAAAEATIDWASTDTGDTQWSASASAGEALVSMHNFLILPWL
ncbi:hypothetical protein PtA15_5A535 [Puccinia triticina]|uniref:Uncharacterized protein n=2 Tax=Puccinia triticina TaxID=208348 RepID=A0ABY7CLT5_9BASI|nr:uncharacterized protein PtA15_5A535 [Puccinia triticina]WAQ84962.1 hypothetical protein PtA15_5A535 [Puccinia triticina]